ncbi:hypothetical protein BIV57_02825 [Mangrovactinospora gilvigrisea]|uniref:SnoaL-like domain-containing protein n=1 Tax=Mangrovactinospora gilvigrisea TaxID=1428644 RepID=A0A1J7BJV5_9ACTN|nr:nuclear transport factor 2 family protein [Mangrovactinospora gilvigrisea]OIV38918.1 hypothetical protein BIV57_02825 [Mangrovactinospora gilvigrisea]
MTDSHDDGKGRRPGARSPSADEAVAAANARFYDAIEHGDMDAMARVWLPEDDGGESVSCVHAGWPVLRGRAEVLRSFALIMANTEYIQFFLTDVEVSVAGADADTAVVTCTENILTGAPADAEPDPEEDLGGADDDPGGPGPLIGGLVVATNVFHRVAGEWRLWAHHGSPVLLGEDEPGDDDAAA